MELWKLEIKFGNRNFEKLFGSGNLKIKYKKKDFWRLIWEWNFWRFDLKGNGVAKIYLKVAF